MTAFTLPCEAVIGGVHYPIRADFREILEIFSYLENSDLPDFIRWQVAMALFYGGEIPQEHMQQAASYFQWFVNCAKPEDTGTGRKLLDWEHDAQMIIADVNKVAGQEIRALPFVHWWTFMAWFHGVGEGQLSTVISIRQKLQTGKKLEAWERDYYRQNKAQIDLPHTYSRQEAEQKRRLLAQLGLGKT